MNIMNEYRWWQNGDHPGDGYNPRKGGEGKVVRRFRAPDIEGAEICNTCGYIYHDHGWIEETESIVCPGNWIVPVYTSRPHDRSDDE